MSTPKMSKLDIPSKNPSMNYLEPSPMSNNRTPAKTPKATRDFNTRLSRYDSINFEEDRAKEKKKPTFTSIFDKVEKNESLSSMNESDVKLGGSKTTLTSLNGKLIRVVRSFLQSRGTQIFLSILTAFILLGDYFRVMLFRKGADLPFDILVFICFFVFALEVILSLIAIKKYFLSFYFFFDVIMTLFLILDVNFITNILFYDANEDVYRVALKIARIIRLIRLIRLMKLFKKSDPCSSSKNTTTPKNGIIKPKAKVSSDRESKVTIELKEANIKRLMVLMLLILIALPLFDSSVYTSQRAFENSDKVRLMIPLLIKYPDQKDTIIQNAQADFKETHERIEMVYIQSLVNYTHPDYGNVRNEESIIFQGNLIYEGIHYEAEYIISHRFENIIQSLLGFINTIFVSLILLLSILNLNQNMAKLVLSPLERMITKLKNVSSNPMLALRQRYTEVQGSEMNETLVIEEAIYKISELLVLGFGQAGCRVISRMLFSLDFDFDQMTSGEKTYAIFGFCDIRNFTDITEILLEDIMVFVNTIADIVHSSVENYEGAANKNIGDAFLLVWKLMDNGYKFYHENENTIKNADGAESKIIIPKGGSLIKEDAFNRQLSELSLLSFIKIIIEINTAPEILEYSENELILEKIPNYKVQMGFGLHIGWAIEGAIGSSFKIDASYLSPNVNLAARLEAATKQFGVPLLFSGSLYDMFTTSRLKDVCRHIDTVTVKGSKQPMKLYTIDLNIDNLLEQQPIIRNLKSSRYQQIPLENSSLRRYNFSTISKRIRTVEENIHPAKFMLSHERVGSSNEESLVDERLRQLEFQLVFDFGNPIMREFRQVFRFGVDSYLKGDWRVAKKFLERCLTIKSDDGPSSVLMSYMISHGFIAPSDWKNFRELLDK